MLKYKDGINKTIALFFAHKNDIDIYIEDKNDNEFYLALFQRLAEKSKISIGKLISLGDRKKVLEACLSDQNKRKRKRLYIIDADLNLINNSNPSNVKHLYIHDVYCIENYLIDENAIIEILHDGYILPKEDISKKMGLTNFLKKISEPLIELFLHYAIVFELCPHIKTVSNGIGNFCEVVDKITSLSKTKVEEKVENLKAEIIKHTTEKEYNEKIYSLKQKWSYTTENLVKIVSAKDYTLPLIHFRFAKIKSKVTFTITRESLRLRLAKLCKLERLSGLEVALKKA